MPYESVRDGDARPEGARDRDPRGGGARDRWLRRVDRALAVVVIVCLLLLLSAVLPGSNVARALTKTVAFFTVQSAVFAAVVALGLGRDAYGRRQQALRTVAAAGVCLSGVVYATVLQPTPEPLTTVTGLVDAGLHYVTPVLALIAVALDRGSRPLGTRGWVLAVAWPLTWLIVIEVSGRSTGWYPYAFVDPGAVGATGAVLRGLAAVGLFCAILAVLEIARCARGHEPGLT